MPRTLRYGEHEDQLVEVHEPTGRPLGTTLVVVHGGFWRQRWDRTHARPQARALADAGHAVALVEYRRVGGAGGWPTTANDVALALRAVADEAQRGAVPRRTVVLGHSAGGMLGLLAAARPAARAGLDLVAVVALGGCLDLALVDALGLSDQAARELMGTDPAGDPAAWAEADPARLPDDAWGGAPVIVVHGEDDEEVPVAVAESFVAAHPGAPVELRLLPGVGHYEPITPGTGAFEAVLTHLEGLTPAR